MTWIRSFLPWLVTAVWMVVVLSIGYVRFEALINMPLNELGDFVAGAAAPLAFFWIVFGYFQHGREIALQVRETARLAEHVEIQARATEDLVNLTRDEQQRDDLRKAMAIKPNLVCRVAGKDMNGFNIVIQNDGGAARDIQSFCDASYAAVFSEQTLDGSNGRKWGHLILDFGSNEAPYLYPISFSIRCRDAEDYVHSVEFSVKNSDPTVEFIAHRIYKAVPTERIVDGELVQDTRLEELTRPIGY